VPRPPHWTQILGFNVRKAALGLAVIAGLLVAAYWGHRRYLVWREQHLVEQARAFLKKSDLGSAVLSARQALELNSRNVAATRLMAEMADQARSPMAIIWRGRVVELAPQSVPDLLAWAETALRMGMWDTADQVLTRIPPASQRTVEFNRAATAVFLGMKQYSLAERSLRELSLLEPTNRTTQLNLATLRVLSSDPQVAAAARAELERFRGDAAFNLQATRALLLDATRHGDTNAILSLGGEVSSHREAEFNDKLLHLQAVLQIRPQDFSSLLSAVQARTLDQPNLAFALISWLNSQRRLDDAAQWWSLMPDSLRAEPAVRIAMAECFGLRGSWRDLETLTISGDWREMDFARLAWLARAQREQGRREDSRKSWLAAVLRTRRNLGATTVLARLAQSWKWNSEAEELLTLMARDPATRLATLKSLSRLYLEQRNARQLLRVTRQLLQLNPMDMGARNNVANLSLLLFEDMNTACLIAEENYLRATNFPPAISTYAFALYRKGKPAEAVKLMSALPASELEQPAMAAYYGVALAAAGDAAAAEKYLTIAEKAPGLFPEETAMVAVARAGSPNTGRSK
jgi:tetratricopeptide (TPR) repeat protein